MRVYRVRDASTAAKSPATPALPVLPLPDKPSIAVLPFANISGDPEEEYFIDGMVEEIDLPVQNIDLRLAGRTLLAPRRPQKRSPRRPTAASSSCRSGSDEPRTHSPARRSSGHP
jgi:hypothetical protein